MWKSLIVFLFCATAQARTLESFFTPLDLYTIQIEHDDMLYQGLVAFQPHEQWWQIHDENQYSFWFNKKGLWMIDNQSEQVQEWTLEDLGTFSPFLADFERFFYQDVLPDQLSRDKLHYQTSRATLTIKNNNQGHIVIGWHSQDGTIVVRFARAFPPTKAPNEWFMIEPRVSHS